MVNTVPPTRILALPVSHFLNHYLVCVGVMTFLGTVVQKLDSLTLDRRKIHRKFPSSLFISLQIFLLKSCLNQ